MGGFLNRLKEKSGIYRLGFAEESIAGITIPLVFVVAVGGIGWVLIRYVF